MPTPFPLSVEVERYKKLRSAATELSRRIVKTIPRKALYEIGEALGILREGVMVFDTEDVTSVLMDCCLYDWLEEGKNLVEKYAESHVPAPGSDEYALLRAYQKARYRIVLPKAYLPGAGVHVVDVLSGEQFFLMDIHLSGNSFAGPLALATRTIPLEGYWITGGAPLVMDAEAAELAVHRLEKAKLVLRDRIVDPHKMALIVVRACLETGAAEHVRFEDPEAPVHSTSGGPRAWRVSRSPGRNEPCPCGSKRKYKKCCGATGRSPATAAGADPNCRQEA